MSVAQLKATQNRQLSAGELHKLVGLNVRIRRRELRLSQEQLGRAIGVSSQQVGKYETGQTRLSLDVLVRIAGALSAPLPYFVPDGRQISPVAAHLLESRQAEELLSTFAHIRSELGRDAVQALAEHFAKQD